ncbi:MAG: ABC transporter substrate-binding protein [Calditrichaeota bacterium]|nr:ABC transporter substrate-binding protein [Calditrichota bacterium]
MKIRKKIEVFPFRLIFVIVLMGLILQQSCDNYSGQKRKVQKDSTIVFKHFKLANAREQFQKAIAEFEKENPGVHVREEILPSNTNVQHQFYVTSLESGAADFDVFLIDVIWTPEFSLAGWLEDLSDLLPEEERKQFFPAPLKADMYKGKLFAIPWYIDAGVLYYRKDLLTKYGFSAPQTFEQLVRQAQTVLKGEKRADLNGFLWQGKQYEGMICTVNEIISGFGGHILDDSNRVRLEDIEVINALKWLKSCIYDWRISPRWVLSADEENTRLSFLNGKTIFLRNWPYCWSFFQREDSPVKGKVGVTRIPSLPGKTGRSTLGGWQLAVNRFSSKKELAKKFVKFMSSSEMQLRFALTVGTKPTRRPLYQNVELRTAQPFIVSLLPVLENTSPRPVTPFYPQISQILQIEFSAILSDIRPVKKALRSARLQIEHVLKLEKETSAIMDKK